MKRLFGIFPVLLLAALFSVSCSNDSEPKRKRIPKKEVFKKLKNYSLELLPVSTLRSFRAGDQKAEMLFSLRNTGLSPVSIKEWHMDESANILLFYTPGELAKAKDIPDGNYLASKTVDEKSKHAFLRAPLILNPSDNAALISVPLAFVREMDASDGTRKPYIMKAKLNLTSVTVESLPFEITVK